LLKILIVLSLGPILTGPIYQVVNVEGGKFSTYRKIILSTFIVDWGEGSIIIKKPLVLSLFSFFLLKRNVVGYIFLEILWSS